MASGIILNQCLHGYADGHQLLASSLELTHDEQALLLVMSDLSGPSFRSGFESYLTGYPLLNSGHYCLARTWFAPELPRPGCVWTHTLIVRNEDLARIQSVTVLNHLFRRPTAVEEAHDYENPLTNLGHIVEPFVVNGDPRAVIQGLYGSDQQIVIANENSAGVEPMVLAIYDQQWPRLRRGFRFCTGALSLRGSEFDLAVCPPEESHSIRGKGIVVSVRRQSDRSFEDWIEAVCRDLVSSHSQAYRQFLWQFGSDYPNGRAALRPLTEIFSLLSSQREGEPIAEKVLSAISHFFPEPTQSRRLKAELFGREGRYVSQIGGELGVTRALVTHPAANAVDSEIANIRDRATALAKRDVVAATELASQAARLGGNNARLFLEGFLTEGLQSETAIQRVPSALLLEFLDQRPELLASPIFWRRRDLPGLVTKAVALVASNSPILPDAINAMMTAEAWDAIASTVGQCGEAALVCVLDFIDRQTSSTIDYPDELFEAIWAKPSIVIDTIEHRSVGPVALKALTAEIDPRSWHLRRLSLTPWVKAARSDLQFASPWRAINSNVFFLSVGLSHRGDEAPFLVAYSFASVYDAAKGDELKRMQWERLEPVLSWYSPSWDRCARLIRTVVRAFRDKEWPLSYFSQTFKSVEQFERALSELDETWRGHRLIRRLEQAGSAGEVVWSSSQLAVLKKFV